jgi:hypothetical protein
MRASLMRAVLLALACAIATASAGSAADRGADRWFVRPFRADSTWNTPIPASARYEAVPGIEGMFGGLNYDDRWGVGVYRATRRDRRARLLIHDWTLWGKLDSGEVKTAGNTREVEDRLRSVSKQFPDFPANFYSTTTRAADAAGRTWPGNIRPITEGWSNTIYVPARARPSPDTDALLAIYQPDGLVLECYDAVVCANGDVVCTMAGFTDPAGDGTGANNGRCASLINCYAGLVRAGEVASGRIRHALHLTCSRKLLAPQAVPPALAFDMNDRYEGSVPMGSLLALPGGMDIRSLGLTKRGEVIARAMREYGAIITDRGGDGGLTLRAALDASDAFYPERATDLTIIVRKLQRVAGDR